MEVEMMTEIKNACFIADRWTMAFGFITYSFRILSYCVKKTNFQNWTKETSTERFHWTLAAHWGPQLSWGNRKENVDVSRKGK